MLNEEFDQIEQLADVCTLDKDVNTLLVLVYEVGEFIGWLLEEENVQVHRDPLPFVVEHCGGIRRVGGSAVDFEADVIVEQMA